MQVVCSEDGQYVYTTSGRFRDGNAVCVFKLGSDGKLKLLQSLSNAGGQLPNFEGGNKIRISPDGRTVYVTATNSNHVVCLQRDPKSGKLTLAELIDSAQLPGSPRGPNGLAFSPDGKHLYVTWENSKAVSPFIRQNGLKRTATDTDPAAANSSGEATIRVTVKREKDQTVIRIENEVVAENELLKRFRYWKDLTGTAKLVVETDADVPWSAFKAIQDAAAGAKIPLAVRIERLAEKLKNDAGVEKQRIIADLERLLAQQQLLAADQEQKAKAITDEEKLKKLAVEQEKARAEIAALQQRLAELQKLLADEQAKRAQKAIVAEADRLLKQQAEKLWQQQKDSADQARKAQKADLEQMKQLDNWLKTAQEKKDLAEKTAAKQKLFQQADLADQAKIKDKMKPDEPTTKTPSAPKRSPAAIYKLQLLELDLEEARLTADMAEKDFKRVESLGATGGIPQEVVDAKRYSLDKAMLAVKRAALKLEQAREEER
jgi:Lactonase, 7-bladed beta-propeller